MLKHFLTYLVLVPGCALVCGCGVHRNLKITEVLPNQVELYLDEPASNRLDLTNMKLKWTLTDPTATPSVTTGELDLGIAGSLQGGQFLVIFENPNYSDVPVAQAFHGPIAGIKVKDGFFPPYGGNPSAAMTVDGSHYRSFVVFVPVYQDKVNDVVTFGPSPRLSKPQSVRLSWQRPQLLATTHSTPSLTVKPAKTGRYGECEIQ